MTQAGNRSGAPAAVILALFLLCAVSWSLAVPPFESPDEPGHARYVDFLMQTRRLPVAGDDARGEAHQPPLYYALAATAASMAGLPPIPVGPRRNPGFRWYGGMSESKYLHPAVERPPLSGSLRTLHWLRLLSVLLGAGTVAVAYRMGLAAGLRLRAALAAMSMVAFLPQFTFIAGMLNNDNLANLLSAESLACLVAGLGRPLRRVWVAAGLLAGLGLLAKFTGLVLLPCGLLAAFLSGTRHRLRSAFLFLIPALLIPLPLLVRNAVVMGDPLGTSAVGSTLPQLVDPKPLLSAYFVAEFPAVLFRSFWGTFGWMSFPMPSWCLGVCLVATLCAAAGLLLMRRDATTARVHLLLGSAVALQLGQIVAYNLAFTQAQGRFLFPVIGPIAILFCAGLAEVARRLHLPSPGVRGVMLGAAGLAIANLCLLRFLVAPAYDAAIRSSG